MTNGNSKLTSPHCKASRVRLRAASSSAAVTSITRFLQRNQWAMKALRAFVLSTIGGEAIVGYAGNRDSGVGERFKKRAAGQNGPVIDQSGGDQNTIGHAATIRGLASATEFTRQSNILEHAVRYD